MFLDQDTNEILKESFIKGHPLFAYFSIFVMPRIYFSIINDIWRFR